MTTERQIAANRRNAQKSTGPRTEQGKLGSRRNAMRHGLCAETVAPSFEDPEKFQEFEAGLIADYAPQSAIEFQLVGRIASLLWRLRRATLIETGLFEMHGRNARRDQVSVDAGDRGNATAYRMFPGTEAMQDMNKAPVADEVDVPLAPAIGDGTTDSCATDVAAVFLRFCRHNDAAAERLARYETALWRQLAHTLMILNLTVRNSFRPRRTTAWPYVSHHSGKNGQLTANCAVRNYNANT
jgi:hypothetical protein